jgi:hypothetical protein
MPGAMTATNLDVIRSAVAVRVVAVLVMPFLRSGCGDEPRP